MKCNLLSHVRYLLLGILILLNIDLRAQDPVTNFNPTVFNVVPPAPNAAGLGRYGDVPVNMFNGLPQISIPLGKITVGNEFSSELSLSYHAGGNRVNDVASSVGLGWSLIAGGVITRTVRGGLDESGYVNGDGRAIINGHPNDASSESEFQIFRMAALGMKDTQPDEFNYNVGGFSGKFVVNTDKQVVLLPYRDIKITWMEDDALSMYFTMVTPDGTTYIFKTKERTSTYSTCGSEALEYISSWYLTQIILPKSKRTIDFTYETDNGYTITSLTQTKSQARVPLTGYCPGLIPIIKSCYSFRNTYQRLLKTVTFPGGMVSFNYNTLRTDVSNDRKDPFYALSDITFSAGFNNVYTNLNKYLLSYSTSGRLMLNKVTQADANGNGVSSYDLAYNPGGLPMPNSFMQDHWGYANGASGNQDLIPGDVDYNGTNREANANYSVGGILQKITYPTGGSTTFEYEGNTYSRYGSSRAVDEPVYQVITAQKSVRAGPTTANQYTQEDSDSLFITINKDQYVHSFTLRHNGQLGYNSLTYTNLTTGEGPTQFPKDNSEIYFTAGKYRIDLSVYYEQGTGTYASVLLKYKMEKEGVRTYILNGGGIRIKKVATYDGIDHKNDIIKTYTYNLAADPTKSSGYLMVQPKYDYRTIYTTGPTVALNICTIYNMASAANNEIESGGSSVVYREVLESTNGNGNTRFVFGVHPKPGIVGFPFGPVTNDASDNGLLVEQYAYDAGGKLVTKTENTYTTFSKNTVEGWKPAYTRSWPSNPGLHFENFASNYYNYKSQMSLLSKAATTVYEANGEFASSVNTFYDNLDHIQPTRTHSVNSKGDDIWTFTKYSTDYNLAGVSIGSSLQAIKFMQDNYIHNLPIEQYVQQVRDGKTTTLAGQFIQYKQLAATTGTQIQMDVAFALKKKNANTGFSPATIVGGELVKSPDYEAKIKFTRYDLMGNILEQQKVDDIPEAYIWGYSGLYPVAKITGSTYDNAISKVNNSIVNNPASEDQLRLELQNLRKNLPNVLVSTYTLKPLIGVTSETDPAGRTSYYEYDLFGRLKVIRDQNGKVLKQFGYQYAQPITQ